MRHFYFLFTRFTLQLVHLVTSIVTCLIEIAPDGLTLIQAQFGLKIPVVKCAFKMEPIYLWAKFAPFSPQSALSRLKQIQRTRSLRMNSTIAGVI